MSFLFSDESSTLDDNYYRNLSCYTVSLSTVHIDDLPTHRQRFSHPLWTPEHASIYVCALNSWSPIHNYTTNAIDLTYKQSALVLYVIAFIYGCLLAAIRSE